MHDEKNAEYKCQSCDSASHAEAGTCCGAQREKMCSCGSGKMAKECCEK